MNSLKLAFDVVEDEKNLGLEFAVHHVAWLDQATITFRNKTLATTTRNRK